MLCDFKIFATYYGPENVSKKVIHIGTKYEISQLRTKIIECVCLSENVLCKSI